MTWMYKLAHRMAVLRSRNLAGTAPVLLAAFAIACNEGATTPTSSPDAPTTEPPTQGTPPLEGSLASVGLIFSDNFDNGLAAWSRETCCSYSATVVQSPTSEGTHSFRDEVRRTDPLIAGRTRSEILRPKLTNWSGNSNGPFGVGDEVWYGFSVYIPTTWTNDGSGNQSTSIQQLHDTPDPRPDGSIDWSKGRAPILSFQFQGSNWMFVSMSGGPYPATPVWHSWNGGAVAKGAWTRFVVHAKWYNDSRGVLQIWKNGTQVVNATGPNTLQNKLPAYFKLGIHKWSWYTWATTSRVAMFDAVRIAGAGGSYSMVAPR